MRVGHAVGQGGSGGGAGGSAAAVAEAGCTAVHAQEDRGVAAQTACGAAMASGRCTAVHAAEEVDGVPVAQAARAACEPGGGSVARGLWFGSADPHGVGDVDRVPRLARASMSMASHVAAGTEEVATRPFAQVNVAPCTAPLAAPAPQPAGAPLVTRREQVVPRATMVLVREWMRSLRRCLRLAEEGQVARARRARPADLWLDHERHSCAATRAWDWDLRPLEAGLPAVPLPTSGRDGVLPATSVCMQALEAESGDFPDQAIVSEMLHGVADDSECRRGTLLCAPHVGALTELAQALAKTRANVDKGWATGGFALPCWPLRTCPFSIVDESVRAGKPKFRLTVDLSWPHAGSMVVDGLAVDSVNGAMDRSRWPANRLVHVTEYGEAMALLQGSARQRRARVWGLDCEAFYRAVGRQRRELWRNGICLPDGVQLDERCCFGDASAATKCARISNYLVFQIRRALRAFDDAHPTRDPGWQQWQAGRRAAAAAAGVVEPSACRAQYTELFWLGMYIDDALGGSADDLLFGRSGEPVIEADGTHVQRAQRHFEITRGVLERFGWGSSVSKEAPPAECVDALGIEVDLAEQRLRLSSDKRERYARQARLIAGGRTCDLASYREMMGRLTFAASFYPVGRQRLHACWRVARAAFRLRGERVVVTRAVRGELAWWAHTLEAAEHEGVPLARCSAMGPPGATSGVVYADASGQGGFSAWTVVNGTVLAVADEWTAEERTLLICELELLASTFGLVAFAPMLPRDVYSFSDNTNAVAAMRSMTSRSAAMEAIIRRRTQWLYTEGRVEEPRRVTSAANLWADIGSRPERGGLREVQRQAAMLGLPFRELSVPASWRDTSSLLLPDPQW